MAEEKNDTPTLNSEDINALRILLHSVRGLSVVATAAPEYVVVDDDTSE